MYEIVEYSLYSDTLNVCAHLVFVAMKLGDRR